MNYQATVHVDLLSTSLDDFVEHMQPQIFIMANLLEQPTGDLKWQQLPPDEDVEWAAKEADLISENWELRPSEGSARGLVMINKRGKTTCSWTIFLLPDNMDADEVKSDIWIKATRYRTDRLNIFLAENMDVHPIIGEYFLNWLKTYWRENEGIDDLIKRGKPLPPLPIELLPTTPPSVLDGYTSDDVFDWYHRGGKLFVPEIQKLSRWLGVSEGTVRNMHADYKKQYASGRKPDTDSHFARMAIPPLSEE